MMDTHVILNNTCQLFIYVYRILLQLTSLSWSVAYWTILLDTWGTYRLFSVVVFATWLREMAARRISSIVQAICFLIINDCHPAMNQPYEACPRAVANMLTRRGSSSMPCTIQRWISKYQGSSGLQPACRCQWWCILKHELGSRVNAHGC